MGVPGADTHAEIRTRRSLASVPPSRRGGAVESAPAEARVQLLGVSMTHAERERSALLFLLLLLAAMVLVMGRAARDALFLTRFPVTWIAPMWMAYAAASSAMALLYTRALAR